jgi:hypothetical protein
VCLLSAAFLVTCHDPAYHLLASYFGLLLDNTKELRKTLEDGNAVIDTINTLRGAECSAPSFTPPTAKPATISGADRELLTEWGCLLLLMQAGLMQHHA